MTWSELIQYANQFSPNADVYVQLHLPVHVCPVNYPLGDVTGDGEIVFLHGVDDGAEGFGRALDDLFDGGDALEEMFIER